MTPAVPSAQIPIWLGGLLARMPGPLGTPGQHSPVTVPLLLCCALGEEPCAPGEPQVSLAFFRELRLLQVCTFVSKTVRAAMCLQLKGLP